MLHADRTFANELNPPIHKPKFRTIMQLIVRRYGSATFDAQSGTRRSKGQLSLRKSSLRLLPASDLLLLHQLYYSSPTRYRNQHKRILKPETCLSDSQQFLPLHHGDWSGVHTRSTSRCHPLRSTEQVSVQKLNRNTRS